MVLKVKKIRNPLALAFGLLIHRKREALNLTSFDLAGPKGMNVGDSTIRSFEAGKAVLPIEKNIVIVQLFPEIQYNKLASLNLAAHYLYNCETQNEVNERIKVLRKADPLLRDFFQVLIPVLDRLNKHFNDSLGSMSNLLEEYNIVNHLERFLTTELPIQQKLEPSDKYIRTMSEKLAEMPSYDADDVLTYLDKRSKQPLLITSQTALEWEQNNSSEISEIYGIVEKYSAITSVENIRLFDYDYLWSGAIIKIIYLDETALSDEATVNNQFFNNLELILKQNRDKRHSELSKKRTAVQFKRFKKNDEINDILKTPFFNKEFQFNNFWAYKLKDEHLLGFLATDQDGKYTYLGISPSQRALRDKVTAFTNLWETL